MDKREEKLVLQRKLIIQHTKMNIQIRKKLKVMISKMPVPEPIENVILNFVGVKKFTKF